MEASSVSATVYESRVYVRATHHDEHPVLVYSSNEDKWSTLTQQQSPSAIAIVNNHITLIGGADLSTRKATNTLSTWNSVENMRRFCADKVVPVGFSCTRMCGWLQSGSYLPKLCSMQQCCTYIKLFCERYVTCWPAITNKVRCWTRKCCGVKTYCWPSGKGKSSRIVGRSVHNQRIERLWWDGYTLVLGQFYTIFYTMDDAELLGPTRPRQIMYLHLSFGQYICKELATIARGRL